MSLDTNTNLKAAIANWLNRTDLTTEIVDFISLTEARIVGDFAENQLLNKLLASETITTDSATKAMNAGYRGTSVAYLDFNPKTVLTYLPPDEFFARWLSSVYGRPLSYTIQGMNMHLGPTPDAEYDLIHWYVKTPDIATDETNSILTNHPNLYLYGALSEAYDFLGNEAKQVKFETRYLQLLEGLEEEGRSLGALQIVNRDAGAGAPRR